ncbi:MAG: T9SS type A sorting domain-containing protein [Saprospiraceae bacterium]|nr:T9SS type A sorting domain-containing protein [Saprospiraceae bacterium]
MKRFFTCFFAILSLNLFAQADRNEVSSHAAKASQGYFLGKVSALRDREPDTHFQNEAPKKLYDKINYYSPNKTNNLQSLPQGTDPLLKKTQDNNQDGGGPQIIPGFNFEGIIDPAGVPVPDVNGDVGKDHYVQMVNTYSGAWFQIWDKVTGNSVYGPARTSTIWGSFGLPTLGDIIIQYDHSAERWIMLEIQANSNNPFNDKQLFMAVSETSDPTGEWNIYLFQTLGFPDYPKLFIWDNAYFITVNELYNGNKCAGYALDRAAILSNEATFGLYRFELPNYASIAFQPATGVSWDQGPNPPAGSPGYIFRVYDDAWEGGQDQLQYWEIHLDWANVNMSHADGPIKLYPEPFETRVCFGQSIFDCIEQPDGSRFTAFENGIMYCAPYQNFGTHESIVLNHVVDVSGQVGDGGDAQVRWYELRKTGSGDWQIQQQGTHAPTLNANRITGTINMDEAGNIGLGYTSVSETVYPSLHITGHRTSDPPGVMGLEEFPLGIGTSNHTTNRWGDYSSMSVDPYDGRTFWFTGEYQPDNTVSWGTRIASFKVQRDTYDIKPELILAPQPSAYLNNEQVTVQIKNNGLLPAQNFAVSLFFENTLIATEAVQETLPEGGAVTHTFTPTVPMTVPGKHYKFRFVTHWNLDQFHRNDTLDVTVQKLTGNDAAMAGRHNLPALVCGTETDFSLILKNASGAPLQSAKINWRINLQAWNVYDWTGNLAPGARDTIELTATGIGNGLNSLRAITSLPNGVQDELINNDSLLVKFFGNTDGTYLSVESETDLGTLHWELRSQTNTLLAQGDVSQSQPNASICADDNQCYKIVLRAGTFNWLGHFVLKNIFGETLVEITEASTDNQVINFCTPPRKQVDVGPLKLLTPETRPNLTSTEPVTVQFRNFGLTSIPSANLSYRVNGGAWHTETATGPFTPSQTIEHTFSSTEDLSIAGNTYHFEMKATVAGDEDLSNDTTSVTVYNRYVRDLEIISIDKGSACGDTSSALIRLIMRNNGLGNQHQADIAAKLNGQALPVFEDMPVDAPSDEITEVYLQLNHLQIGNNNLEVRIIDVDGDGTDENTSNDAASISFDVNPVNTAMNLVFATDAKPGETTWDIVNTQGQVVASGGPYLQPISFNFEGLCLPKDSCYTFRIHDSGGDGMEGGYVQLSIESGLVFEYSAQNFGAEISIPFCAVSLCASLELSADVTPSSGQGINDGRIIAEANGGTPPYLFTLNGIITQDSAVFNNLLPGAYTVVCIDAVGCVEEITVNIGSVSANEPGNFRRLLISPNPTIGIAHIQMSADGIVKVSPDCEVFDQHGKRIQVTRMSRWGNDFHGNIALDQFPSGVYFLRVLDASGTYIGRVVKK